MTSWNTPVEIDPNDNSTRAARVLQAIYPAYDDFDAYAAVRDVMVDLRHLCDLMAWDYADLDGDARRGYLHELQEASGPANNPELKASIEKDLM